MWYYFECVRKSHRRNPKWNLNNIWFCTIKSDTIFWALRDFRVKQSPCLSRGFRWVWENLHRFLWVRGKMKTKPHLRCISLWMWLKKIPTFSDAKTPSFPQCHRVSLVNYLVQCLNLFSSLSGGFGILESTPDTILLRELKFGPVIEPKWRDNDQSIRDLSRDISLENEVDQKHSAWRYRAFSCDVIAAMLEAKNNTFSLLWEIRSIFMQNCFIVSALQHGRCENLLQRVFLRIVITFLTWTNTDAVTGTSFSFPGPFPAPPARGVGVGKGPGNEDAGTQGHITTALN